MKTIRVGLVGLGTVGSGVAKLLLTKNYAFPNMGVNVELTRIAELDRSRLQQPDFTIPDSLWTNNIDDIVHDESISVVVQVIGGLSPSRQFMLRLLSAGKHVVTANKALLAHHGQELFECARQHDATVSFEASTGGGIPILASLRDGFAGNSIQEICGIVNGTSNFILTEMEQKGVSYDACLKTAQEKGYAEANPALDVNGTDSAHKLVILCAVGFGAHVPLESVWCEGIQDTAQTDIQYARDLGYILKLVAIAKRIDNELEVRVHPALLPQDHPLTSVSGVFNGIMVKGDAVGDTMLYGKGAGSMPTASAVVGDVLDAALGRAQSAFNRLRLFNNGVAWNVRKMEDVSTRYYLRFTVIDQPGVLAKISGILGDHAISIASMMQKEHHAGNAVPVVMTTHMAREGDVRDAIQKVDGLDVIAAPSRFFRIEADN